MTWTLMHLKKKDLDKWLRKKLMKMAVTKARTVEISYGGRKLLRERKKEITEPTMKLMIAAGQRELVELFLNEMPEELLYTLANSDSYTELHNLRDKQKFAALIPSLLKRADLQDSYDLPNMILKITGLPGACEKYKDEPQLQIAIAGQDQCPFSTFMYLFKKHRKEWLGNGSGHGTIHDKLLKYIKQGKLDIVEK